MSVLNKLFSRSPFSALQAHMEKVSACVLKMEELVTAYFEKDFKAINRIVEDLSDLEHEADITKNEIRNNLPKGLFMPVNRADLLEILALQDTIADKAEDVGVLFSLKKLEPVKSLEADVKMLLEKNIEAFNQTHRIIRQMDELLETSFGGKEAEKVRNMVSDVEFTEHEIDIMQRKLLKKLYNLDDKIAYNEFYLYISILQTLTKISDISEKIANRVRMMLDFK